MVNLEAREPNGEVLAEDLVGLGELCGSEKEEALRVSFGFRRVRRAKPKKADAAEVVSLGVVGVVPHPSGTPFKMTRKERKSRDGTRGGGGARAPFGRLFRGPFVGDRSPSNAFASAASGAHATSAAAAAVATAAPRRRSATETLLASSAERSARAAHATERRARGAFAPDAGARAATGLETHADIEMERADV